MTVHFIGAGPGAAGLLTLRGAQFPEAAVSTGLKQAAIILVGKARHAEDFVESHLYRSRCTTAKPR
ncbi:MAG: hypothetical protein Q4D79_05275 [Propionibacteriaceae bacterium]|nr:hypothetical protein [Propionibacteriaceae bacterium]